MKKATSKIAAVIIIAISLVTILTGSASASTTLRINCDIIYLEDTMEEVIAIAGTPESIEEVTLYRGPKGKFTNYLYIQGNNYRTLSFQFGKLVKINTEYKR